MAENSRQIGWNQNLEAVRAFSIKAKQWPSTTATDSTEKSLAQWWSRQKYLLNKKAMGEPSPGMTDEREALIRGLIEGNSSLERDGIWNARYEAVFSKFKADNKLWPYASENEEEQKNIRWWNQQKTFARKYKQSQDKAYGGMTQERYDKIVSLMKLMGQDLEEASNDSPVTTSSN